MAARLEEDRLARLLGVLVEHLERRVQVLLVHGHLLVVQPPIDHHDVGRTDRRADLVGEHGGDADSICFFEEVGLDYVSCSPFRVPAARLAAAQAAIKNSA